MKIKSDKWVKREIQKRNKQFKGKTRAEKRVLIAKDVISQVRSGKIEALTGSYVISDFRSNARAFGDISLGSGSSVQKGILKYQNNCSACALGSMMISCTLFNNKEKLGDFDNHFEDIGYEITRKKLPNQFNVIFSPEQLTLIESAFEKTDMNDIHGRDFKISDAEIRKAIDFGYNAPDEDDRLIAIMKNIIKNKGTFKP